MDFVFSAAQLDHRPGHFLVRGRPQPVPELGQRAEVLAAAARAAGHRGVVPGSYGAAPREAVHTPRYLAFLESAWDRWRALPNASAEVIPNVHPDARSASYPRAIVGQVGFHMMDTACPIAGGSWPAIQASADTAIEAARLVQSGAKVAYALCRPPGHHAFADAAGGFCYLNNSAIAACDLRRGAQRVAILDVDLHHGNGTQGIFYERADVLTVSIHADPTDFYPFFWGHAAERGRGAGEGFNLNLPLALGSGDKEFLAALVKALEAIRDFRAEALVVALGLDAFEGDPLAGLRVTTDGFREIARAIGALKLPSVLVQEGGYLCPALGRNLVAFLDGFEEGVG